MTLILKCTRLIAALTGIWAMHGVAHAQLVIEDTLTGASSSFNWQAINGACLTAGDNTGTIPACVGLPYYSGKIHVGGTTGRLPDAVGSGALRLNNGDTINIDLPGNNLIARNGTGQSGAVVSNFTFPSNTGLQVTFRTVTYGGNAANGTGADGIAFFLADGSKPVSIGALGGGLGYRCNSGGAPSSVGVTNHGVAGAYLGIGIDEYGNFGNPNAGTGIILPPPIPPATSPKYPNRITLRAGGDVHWDSLNARKPAYYPSSLSAIDRELAVHGTCKSKRLQNYSGAAITDANGNLIADRQATTEDVGSNYGVLSYGDVVAGISNQQALNMPKRGDAIPIDYTIKITQSGLLDFSFSVNGGAPQLLWNGQSITAANGPMPATFRFGFSASTGRGSNVHEILCFKAAPVTSANTSTSGNVEQQAVKIGSQLYLASYQPLNWWGQMTAQDILETATGGLSVSPVANWDASCSLTGGNCAAITPASAATPTTVTAQAPNARTLLTWSGAAGVALRWASLSAAQQATLSAGDYSGGVGADRLQYLRGDRSNEVTGISAFRTRSGVLGDIIDSSPTWVGAPTQLTTTVKDKLLPSAVAPESTGQTYAAFKTAKASRQNLVYVGANDGYMHAFKAGMNDASGNFVGNSVVSPNDGREAMAYMPSLVLDTIHSTTPSMDLASPQYAHNFYVNATPATGDIFYSGAWHTWLVSGLGAGGNAAGPIADQTSTAKGSIFALDITDPGNFSESNASAMVMGDWTTDTISCVNVPNCGTHLGSIVGTPLVRRLHNGQWAFLFGNGLNSSSGKAGIFVLLVDPANGNKSFRFLPASIGPVSGSKNGIANVASADLDLDSVTDYVYAGDVKGNLWRFDLTSSDPDDWDVCSIPVFKTPGGQPIMGKPVVAIVPGSAGESRPRLMLGFGTGQRLPQTQSSDAVYASGSHALYGVWDYDMSDWNSKGSTSQFATLPGPLTSTYVADLQTQTVTSTTTGNSLTIQERTVSSNKVCWRGSSSCPVALDNKRLGWTLALPASNEQAFFNPVLDGAYMLINTTIPGDTVAALTCDNKKPPTGYTMGLSMAEGGATATPLFASATSVAVNGIGLGATGTPMVMRTSKGKKYVVNQAIRFGSVNVGASASDNGYIDCNASGRCSTANRIFDAPGLGKRINWMQVR
jgi:type IV pilus assembly protein PilY1